MKIYSADSWTLKGDNKYEWVMIKDGLLLIIIVGIAMSE